MQRKVYALAVYETAEDMDALRDVLDASYASAGSHLLEIHTDNWRLSAEQIVETLTGMVIVSLATITSKGAPILAPVDGMFYRGRFWFGSSPESMRAKHIAHDPRVSAGHIRGEELAVTVHGIAIAVDKKSERGRGFRDYAAEIYGDAMIDHHWDGTAPYWEIEPHKMFALAPKV
jgi:hypothetical protein